MPNFLNLLKAAKSQLNLLKTPGRGEGYGPVPRPLKATQGYSRLLKAIEGKNEKNIFPLCALCVSVAKNLRLPLRETVSVHSRKARVPFVSKDYVAKRV
jgi:hypothetical protein